MLKYQRGFGGLSMYMGIVLVVVMAGSAAYFKYSQDKLAEANQIVAAQTARANSAEANLKFMQESHRKQQNAIQELADFVEDQYGIINNTNVTTITTVDAAVALIAKWVIRVEEVATPGNVYSTEMIATHDGTSVDSTKYAILKLGSNITGLDITITLTGGDTLNVNVVSTDAVNVVTKRIMVV